MVKIPRPDIRDWFVFGGLLLACSGIAMMMPAASLIVAGSFLVFLGLR